MFDTTRLSMAIGRGIILPVLLTAFLGANSLSAQQAETSGDQSPALIAGRDAIVNYGLSPEQVQELTKAAAAGAVGPLADRIVDLSNRLGVTQGATLTMLRILGQGDVPLEQLPQKLAEVADQYKKFEAQLAALNPQNPLARRLVEQAQAEIKAANADSLIKGSPASPPSEAGAIMRERITFARFARAAAPIGERSNIEGPADLDWVGLRLEAEIPRGALNFHMA
jgi:hypothetical protein